MDIGGYGLCCAVSRKPKTLLPYAERVYRIMRQNALLLERKPYFLPSKRAHTGKVVVGESNQLWCSDGFVFRCDNGEKLRVTFALDCCDR